MWIDDPPAIGVSNVTLASWVAGDRREIARSANGLAPQIADAVTGCEGEIAIRPRSTGPADRGARTIIRNAAWISLRPKLGCLLQNNPNVTWNRSRNGGSAAPSALLLSMTDKLRNVS